MAWNELSPTVRLLALLARGRPEFYDVFPPHGAAGLDRLESVALNPQPLPPRDPLVAGAVTMATRIGAMAVEADVRGEQPADWVTEIIDEWCGTLWPRKWPWPGPGPGPGDGPVPDPWVVNAARAAGASVFASLASDLGGEVGEVFARGAERLADAATQDF